MGRRVAMVMLVCSVALWAQGQMRSAQWKGELTGPKAHGTCRIQTADGVSGKVFVDVGGLDANRAYALWVGDEPAIRYDFKADAHGEMHASASLTAIPSEKRVVVKLTAPTSRFVPLLSGTLTQQ